MTVQFSVAVRNARLDAVEVEIGTSPILELRTGAKPSNCASADSGTVVATMTLPSDWMAAASSGAKGLSGTWEDASADNAGTVGHFRIKDSGGTTCHMQGSVTETGGGGDMELQDVELNAGQAINITGFDLTDGNA